jgi:hypothetical protein
MTVLGFTVGDHLQAGGAAASDTVGCLPRESRRVASRIVLTTTVARLS